LGFGKVETYGLAMRQVHITVVLHSQKVGCGRTPAYLSQLDCNFPKHSNLSIYGDAYAGAIKGGLCPATPGFIAIENADHVYNDINVYLTSQYTLQQVAEICAKDPRCVGMATTIYNEIWTKYIISNIFYRPGYCLYRKIGMTIDRWRHWLPDLIPFILDHFPSTH
jgi:hypothetical protein